MKNKKIKYIDGWIQQIFDFGWDIFIQSSNPKTFNSASFEFWNSNASAWKHVIEDIVTDSESFVSLCCFQFIWFKTTFDFLPFNFPFDNNELGPQWNVKHMWLDRCTLFSFFFLSFFPLSLSFFNFEEYYFARHVMIYFICQLYLTCFHLNSSYFVFCIERQLFHLPIFCATSRIEVLLHSYRASFAL